jgi:hypothetical protein
LANHPGASFGGALDHLASMAPVDRNAGDARAVPVLSARLDSVACRTASAARLSRSAKPPGHADCVHRGKGVLGVWPLKLARDAVLAEQPAPAACQKFHDLVFRRHGTVLVGTSPANVAAGAAADQGRKRAVRPAA